MLFFFRDENPAGVWTLKVLDQSNPGETGTLLGWTMRLWGEAPEGVLPNPVPLPPGRTLVTTKTNRPPPKTTTTTTKAPPPPPPPPATTTTTEPPSTGSQPSNDTSSDGQPSSRSPGLFALIGVAVFVALAGGVIYHLRRKVTRPDEPKDWEFQQLDDMGDDDIDGFLDDLGDDELDEGLQSARGYQFKNNGAAV